jgi:deoxyribodipyrimidine photolyase-related protein
MAKAIWILNDQLHPSQSALQRYEVGDVVLMAESYTELNRPFAHIKRTAFILAANRQWAQTLTEQGVSIRYVKYTPNTASTQIDGLAEETRRAQLRNVVVVQPKDYHHREALSALHDLSVERTRDTNLISDESAINAQFKGRNFRMETFYRALRREHGILMKDDQPIGGAYNFDQANQAPLKSIPATKKRVAFKPSSLLREVVHEVERDFAHQLGSLHPFYFALSPVQAEAELNHFLRHILVDFGRYQDNIVLGDAYMSHALISSYLNLGLLDPLTVCRKAEQAYNAGHAPIEAVEGFIRQILGWREYMFYRYHWGMPELEHLNGLRAYEALPSFYWTGQTQMRCVANAVEDTLEHAYAHHIQRLMVTANFANLAGIEPQQADAWYGGVYADAWPWVHVPNTLGMGLYADLGVIGSKPYVSSGAYLDRMSNACQSCVYNPKELLGEYACPFNALYWNYIAKHRARFERHPRMAMMVRSYDRFDAAKKSAIEDQARTHLARMRAGVL